MQEHWLFVRQLQSRFETVERRQDIDSLKHMRNKKKERKRQKY